MLNRDFDLSTPLESQFKTKELRAAFAKAEKLIIDMLSMFPDMPGLAKHYEDDLKFNIPTPLDFLSKFMTMRAEMEIALMGLRRFEIPEPEKLIAIRNGMSLEGRVPMDLGWDKQKENLLGSMILQFKEHIQTIRILTPPLITFLYNNEAGSSSGIRAISGLA